jgi:hypothetical protein
MLTITDLSRNEEFSASRMRKVVGGNVISNIISIAASGSGSGSGTGSGASGGVSLSDFHVLKYVDATSPY